MKTAVEQDPKLDGIRQVAVVVAHPDDETLWAGGLLLSHPEWEPFIVTLCRGKDPDRAPKFQKVLTVLNAKGAMGDSNDGPDQIPLAPAAVASAILSLLPAWNYDLVLTHAPGGEYTRHRRHEEVSQALWKLWLDGNLRAARLWQFAYEDGGGVYPPRASKDANLRVPLSPEVWNRKYHIVTQIYGFASDSWEAIATTRSEAFHCFSRQESIDRPERNPRKTNP